MHDKSHLALEHRTAASFDSLPIEQGESILFTGLNGTFHRSFGPAFAATDRAAYCSVARLVRVATWRRFPYSGIKCVQIESVPRWQVAAQFVLGCLISFGASFLLATGVDSVSLRILLLCAAGYISYLVLKSVRGRSRLIFLLNNGSAKFSSPADGYEEEKALDRQLLSSFVDTLAEQGVTVVRAADSVERQMQFPTQQGHRK